MEGKKMEPITITLEPKETVSIGTIFSILAQVMKTLDLELPIEIKQDMAEVLRKMMVEVERQLSPEG